MHLTEPTIAITILLLSYCKFIAQPEQSEYQSRACVPHPLVAALNKYALELHEYLKVQVDILRVSHKMHELCDSLLPLFELVSLLTGAIFIILQEWHDEIYQLLDSLRRAQLVLIIDDRAHNTQGDSSAISKLHVLHECGIVVHIEYCDEQAL
jgi:hypothetical protein